MKLVFQLCFGMTCFPSFFSYFPFIVLPHIFSRIPPLIVPSFLHGLLSSFPSSFLCSFLFFLLSFVLSFFLPPSSTSPGTKREEGVAYMYRRKFPEEPRRIETFGSYSETRIDVSSYWLFFAVRSEWKEYGFLDNLRECFSGSLERKGNQYPC